MRKITRQSALGDIEIDLSEKLVEIVASRLGVSTDSVSEEMILGFLNDASSVAFDRAAAEYVAPDGKDT